MLILTVIILPRAAEGQGIFVTGVGAINRSMGSAAAAAPLDAAGAINTNAATMSGLPSSETEFGLELVLPDTEVSSELSALGRSGSTDADSTATLLPTFASVWRDEDSAFTYGLAFLSVAGFRTDYPASTTNPVLAPQQNGGLGRVVGSADFYQVVPAVSYQATPGTALGIAPMLTIGKIEANPFVFAEPNADGTYPSGADPNYHYGGGFQAGLFHQTASGLNFGAAFKSKQWMETFTSNTTDENGLPRKVSVDVDLPLILSVGTSYTGCSPWLFAVDLRYFDYGNASGFEQEGFDSNGAVKGVGWDSIFSVSSGIQYQVTDRASLRIGYTYHQSPIDNDVAFFNVASPLITEHVLALGCSYEFAVNTIVSLAYVHGFENSVSGPLIRPALGEVPETSVTNTTSADSIAIELTLRR